MAKILVIDDDDATRGVLRELLEEEGHVVMEAADGSSGLQVFRERSADLVVVDIVMPGKNGVTTLGELHMESPQTKIIAISGADPSEALADLPIAWAFGAVRSMQKPLLPSSFLRVVEELLASAQPAPL